MTEVEKIAQWLENLHCNHWNDEIGCWKSNCVLFRELADSIRSGDYE